MITAEYVAGLVDGEGSLCVNRVREGVYQAAFTITNTDLELLEKVQAWFIDAGVRAVVIRYKKRENRRRCYDLFIKGREIKKALAIFKDSLISKKDQAEAVLQVVEITFPQYSGKSHSDEEKHRLEELAGYVSWLNHGCV